MRASGTQDVLVLAGARAQNPAVAGEQALTGPLDVVCRGGWIEAVEPHRPNRGSRGVIQCDDLLLTPGYVNGHTHSHEALHRGRHRKDPLEVWMHFMRPPTPLPLEPQETYVRTALSALSILRGGCTTVVDDTFLPSFDEAHVAAVEAAYTDVGLRARPGLNAFDQPFYASMPFVQDELRPELLDRLGSQGAPETQAVIDLVTVLLAREASTDRVRWIATPSAPQRCSERLLTEMVTAARREGAPVVVHVNETRMQAVTAQQLYGKTLTAYLDDLDLLGAETSLVHGVWLTDDDVARVVARDATIQHNPISNQRLGSGIAPVANYQEAGARVSLGTDGLASCVSVSMAEAVKHTGLLSAVASSDRAEWVDASRAFAMATHEGAAALGLGDELGLIEPGRRADLCGWRLDCLAFTPLNDALRQLVYADVLEPWLTVIDGEVVLRQGIALGVDERWIRQEAARIAERHSAAIAVHEAFVQGELRSPFERVYDRAMREPLQQPPIIDVAAR